MNLSSFLLARAAEACPSSVLQYRGQEDLIDAATAEDVNQLVQWLSDRNLASRIVEQNEDGYWIFALVSKWMGNSPWTWNALDTIMRICFRRLSEILERTLIIPAARHWLIVKSHPDYETLELKRKTDFYSAPPISTDVPYRVDDGLQLFHLFKAKWNAFLAAKRVGAATGGDYFQNSFDYPYIDVCVGVCPSTLDRLMCYIRQVRSLEARKQQSRRYYSRYFPVVQSSGFGKSRLLYELAIANSDIIVVPICFRPEGAVGVPPRTPLIADFLLSYDFYEQSQWEAFFAAVQWEVTGRLVNDPDRLNSTVKRKRLYTELSGTTPGAENSFWSAVVRKTTDIQRAYCSRQGVTSSTEVATANNVAMLLYTTAIDQLRAELSTSESQSRMDWMATVTVVVVLDESSEMLLTKRAPTVASNSALKLVAMARALSLPAATTYYNDHLIAIPVDTSYKITNFAPTAPWFPSLRTREGGSELYAPFSLLPLTVVGAAIPAIEAEEVRKLLLHYQYVYRVPIDGNSTSSSTSSIGVQEVGVNLMRECLLSRPVFSTMAINLVSELWKKASSVRELTSSSSSAPRGPTTRAAGLRAAAVENVFNTIFSFAREKLMPSSLSDRIDSVILHFSLAAIRFHLTTVSQPYQTTLVGQHMCVLYGMDEGRAAFAVGYPLEPLLLRVAASQMIQDRGEDKHWADVLDSVRYFQASGSLQTSGGKGEAGEAVALILLCRAFDCAVRRDQRRTAATHPRHHPVDARRTSIAEMARPVSLMSFLSELYDEEAYESIMESIKNNESLHRLLHGSVYFLGAHKVEVSIDSPDLLEYMLESGSAILAANNENGIDGIIPVMLPKKKRGKLQLITIGDRSLYDLTAILIQVKNRQDRPHQKTLLRHLECHALATTLQHLNLPVVGLIMNMGVSLKPPFNAVIEYDVKGVFGLSFYLNQEIPCLPTVDALPVTTGLKETIRQLLCYTDREEFIALQLGLTHYPEDGRLPGWESRQVVGRERLAKLTSEIYYRGHRPRYFASFAWEGVLLQAAENHPALQCAKQEAESPPRKVPRKGGRAEK